MQDAVLAGALLVLAGCGRERSVDIANWSSPVEVAKSSDSLSTSFSLYRWNGSVLALGGDAGTFAARVLEEDGRTWKTASTNDPEWIPMDADAKENRFVIARATLWRNSMEARFSIGSLSSDGRFMVKTTVALRANKAQLFPNSPPNLEINENERPGHVAFTGGVMESTQIRVPYSIRGALIQRKGHQIGISGDAGANGVFASSDGGRTWRSEPIAVRPSLLPVLCRTKAFYYYFGKGGLGGAPYALWYSRCPAESSSWSPPETMNKTLADKLSERLHALGENDTVHLCWLDARHERTRLSLARPRDGNYEVAYCRRRDSDAGWSQEVILSKGLRWAYAPSMAVEGEKLVVAWAGAGRDTAGRNEWNASDIFYVTSQDGGETWTEPIKITDGFKDGITSGRPQVALRHGIIHLFYIRGTIHYKEVSAGMALLNQPPWPIYHQRRLFPN